MLCYELSYDDAREVFGCEAMTRCVEFYPAFKVRARRIDSCGNRSPVEPWNGVKEAIRRVKGRFDTLGQTLHVNDVQIRIRK